jgi:hypothetical protein
MLPPCQPPSPGNSKLRALRANQSDALPCIPACLPSPLPSARTTGETILASKQASWRQIQQAPSRENLTQKERGPEDPLSYRGWPPPDQADRGRPWDRPDGRIGAARAIMP